MDKNIQILLNSYKHTNAVDVDLYTKLELENNSKNILEYDITNIVSATEVFNIEREAYPIYRIYGRIEYLSILNNITKEYSVLQDFFIKDLNIDTNKNLLNSFDIYLLKPHTEYIKINSGSTSDTYIRQFEVIATFNDIDIYNAGFTKNLFGEQIYSFNFKNDYDITNYVEISGTPVTQLFLYFQYKPSVNGFNELETMSASTWNVNTGLPEIEVYNSINYNVGDIIKGDKIQFTPSQYLESQTDPLYYYIQTQYSNNYLEWLYNPLIPLQLNYLSSNVNQVSTGSTNYDDTSNIPTYAIDSGDGNMIWRNILPQGYYDPTTNNGVNYPFLNKRRYLFAPVILSVQPNLNHANTASVFSEIKFQPPTIINYTPSGDITNIGQPCN